MEKPAVHKTATPILGEPPYPQQQRDNNGDQNGGYRGRNNVNRPRRGGSVTNLINFILISLHTYQVKADVTFKHTHNLLYGLEKYYTLEIPLTEFITMTATIKSEIDLIVQGIDNSTQYNTTEFAMTDDQYHIVIVEQSNQTQCRTRCESSGMSPLSLYDYTIHKNLSGWSNIYKSMDHDRIYGVIGKVLPIDRYTFLGALKTLARNTDYDLPPYWQSKVDLPQFAAYINNEEKLIELLPDTQIRKCICKISSAFSEAQYNNFQTSQRSLERDSILGSVDELYRLTENCNEDLERIYSRINTAHRLHEHRYTGDDSRQRRWSLGNTIRHALGLATTSDLKRLRTATRLMNKQSEFTQKSLEKTFQDVKNLAKSTAQSSKDFYTNIEREEELLHFFSLQLDTNRRALQFDDLLTKLLYQLIDFRSQITRIMNILFNNEPPITSMSQPEIQYLGAPELYKTESGTVHVLVTGWETLEDYRLLYPSSIPHSADTISLINTVIPADIAIITDGRNYASFNTHKLLTFKHSRDYYYTTQPPSIKQLSAPPTSCIEESFLNTPGTLCKESQTIEKYTGKSIHRLNDNTFIVISDKQLYMNIHCLTNQSTTPLPPGRNTIILSHNCSTTIDGRQLHSIESKLDDIVIESQGLETHHLLIQQLSQIGQGDAERLLSAAINDNTQLQLIHRDTAELHSVKTAIESQKIEQSGKLAKIINRLTLGNGDSLQVFIITIGFISILLFLCCACQLYRKYPDICKDMCNNFIHPLRLLQQRFQHTYRVQFAANQLSPQSPSHVSITSPSRSQATTIALHDVNSATAPHFSWQETITLQLRECFLYFGIDIPATEIDDYIFENLMELDEKAFIYTRITHTAGNTNEFTIFLRCTHQTSGEGIIEGIKLFEKHHQYRIITSCTQSGCPLSTAPFRLGNHADFSVHLAANVNNAPDALIQFLDLIKQSAGYERWQNLI